MISLPFTMSEGTTLNKEDTAYERAEKRADSIYDILTREGPCTQADLCLKLGGISYQTFAIVLRDYLNNVPITRGAINFDKTSGKMISTHNQSPNFGLDRKVEPLSFCHKDDLNGNMVKYIEKYGETKISVLATVFRISTSKMHNVKVDLLENPELLGVITHDKKNKTLLLTEQLKEKEHKEEQEKIDLCVDTAKTLINQTDFKQVNEAHLIRVLLKEPLFHDNKPLVLDTLNLVKERQLLNPCPDNVLMLPIVIPKKYALENSSGMW